MASELAELLTETQLVQMGALRAALEKQHKERQEENNARTAAVVFGTATQEPTGELL